MRQRARVAHRESLTAMQAAMHLCFEPSHADRATHSTWHQALAPGVPMEAVLEALPAGIVLLGTQGEVRALNESAREILGEVAPGELWRLVVERVVRPRWDDGHDVTLVNGRRVNIGTRAMPGGVGQLVLVTDVTETRRLQDLLERYQRSAELGQMAATLAHQLRTPVATAMLNCGSIAAAIPRDEVPSRAMSRMTNSLRRLERLVDNLLAYARGGRLELGQVPVASLLSWLSEDLAPLATEQFRIAMPTGKVAGEIAVNESALRSVLLNLAENARDVTKGHGRLLIEVSVAASELRLAFRDNGPGVPEANRQHIFQPFISSRPNGTGLGLAVAKTVIEAHGGHIHLESPESGGACFVVSLPVQASIQGGLS